MSPDQSLLDFGNQFEPINPQECFDILMNVPVSIFRSTPDGRLLSANHTAAQKLGYDSPQELVESITDLASQIYADPGERQEILRLLEAEDKVEDFECRMLRRDGSMLWVSNTVQAIRSQEGNISHYQGVAIDISERKRSEELRQESEAKSRIILEAIPDLMFVLNNQGVHLEYYASDESLLAVRPEDFLGKTIHDVLPKKLADPYFSCLQLALETRKTQIMEYELEVSGDTKFFEAHISAIDDQRLMSIVRDMTERKQAEKALRESEARFQTVLENLPGGVFTYDLDGRFLLVNKAACQNTGYSREELLQLSVEDIDPDAAIRDDFWFKIEQEQSVVIESTHIRRDGSQYPAEVYLSSITLEGQPAILAVAFDITWRKQAEKAQQESEQKFKALAEKCPTSVMLFDEQGRVDFVNDWHIEKFANNKLSKDYFLGKSIHELPGLVNAGVDTQVARIFQGGSIELKEVYFPEFPVGGSGWVSIRAVPIHQDSQIAGGILIQENITTRKQIEAALQESQQKFRSLVENAQDIIFSHTPDGFLTYLSPGVTELLGYEVQNVIGRNFQDFVYPQDLPGVQNHLQEMLGTSNAQYGIEHRILDKNGQWRWFYVNASPQTNAGGEVESIVGVAHDITERKQMEEALKEMRLFLGSTLDSIPYHLAVLDHKGEIVLVNQPWKDFAEENDIIAEQVSEGVNYISVCLNATAENSEEAHSFAEGIRMVVSGEIDIYSMEYPCHSPDKQRWFIGQVTPFLEAPPRRVVVGHANITERIQAEAEKEQLRSQMMQTRKMQSIGNLAGGVAHEFNNLLQVMSGNIQLLLMRKSADDIEYQRLKSVEKAINRAASFVNQLLLFSRKSEASRQYVDLRQGVEEAVRILEQTIPRMVQIQCNLADDLWPIYADPVQIEQVVLNLGKNA
ncbi:MAG: PAS domain S-box protein, partial [Thermodesulfobacteriota bacterium]